MTARGTMVHALCAVCGQAFSARQADRKRGWAKCCGKACAAKLRERRGLPVLRPLGLATLPVDSAMRTDGPEFDFGEDAT